MADKGIKLKRCIALSRSGAPCRAWQTLDSPLCSMHKHHGASALQEAPKKQPKPTGRPPIAEDVWERVLVGLRAGLSYAQAAKEAGTAYRTLADKRNADPTFARASALAFEEGTSRFEEKMYELADTGHYNALLSTLKARSPERWSDKLAVEQKTSVEIDPANRIESILGLIEKLKLRSDWPVEYIEAEVVEEPRAIESNTGDPYN